MPSISTLEKHSRHIYPVYSFPEQVEEIVRTIGETCHSGKIGDGKILVYPLDDVIRIRTFERGEAAV